MDASYNAVWSLFVTSTFALEGTMLRKISVAGALWAGRCTSACEKPAEIKAWNCLLNQVCVAPAPEAPPRNEREAELQVRAQILKEQALGYCRSRHPRDETVRGRR